jgi:hypothetical protein
MIPQWMSNLLMRLPGCPLLHCYIIMALFSFIPLIPDSTQPVLNFLIESLQGATWGLAVYFLLFLSDLNLNFKEIVDARDYAIIRSVAAGALAGFVMSDSMKVINHVFGIKPVADIWEWLAIAGSLLLFPWRVWRYFNGVTIVAGQLPNWTSLFTAYRRRVEGNEFYDNF